MEKTILVTGATGQQGGAVAKHLMKDGWKVRALVRDPNAEKAQKLSKQGAELVKGDLFDKSTLDEAVKGAYGVFSVQNFWLPDVGFEGEITQGKLLADAAKEAGVEHFVYSSVGGAHRGEGQRHFGSKWRIEQYLDEIKIPHTVIRPAAFMDNIEWKRVQISHGEFPSWGIHTNKSTQLIAVDDIGSFAAIMFSDRSKYLGTTLEISGDELTETEQAAVLTKVIGRRVEVGSPEQIEGESDEEHEAGMRFFNGEGYSANIVALRKIHPRLKSLEDYLRASGWENLPVLPMPEGDK